MIDFGMDLDLTYTEARAKLLAAFRAAYIKRLLQRATSTNARAKLAGMSRCDLRRLLRRDEQEGAGS